MTKKEKEMKENMTWKYDHNILLKKMWEGENYNS